MKANCHHSVIFSILAQSVVHYGSDAWSQVNHKTLKFVFTPSPLIMHSKETHLINNNRPNTT